MLAFAAGALGQEDPAKKLGAFVGKWQSEGTFSNGVQVASTLDCRWSEQSDFLICEQAITMAGTSHHQLTVYSYSSREQAYSYTTLAEPGARPTSGSLQINGNVWTYSASLEREGRRVLIRTTNEFTSARTETFKVEVSEDGGAIWSTQLHGKSQKTGE